MSTVASLLDRYREGDSFLHRADARVKLVLTLGFIVAMTSLPSGAWYGFGAMLVLVWVGAILSGVGIRRIFQRSLLAVPFVLIALPSVFLRPGEILAEWDLGLWVMRVSAEGLVFFASVLVKSWTSVTAAALLTAITPPLQILDALRALKVPALLVAIVNLMYRYLFVLIDEVQRLLRARSARSAKISEKSGGPLTWRAKAAGGMAGALFIRSLDRSERIYLAMLARGYDGQVRRLGPASLGKGAMATLAGGLGIFAAIAVAGRWPW